MASLGLLTSIASGWLACLADTLAEPACKQLLWLVEEKGSGHIAYNRFHVSSAY